MLSAIVIGYNSRDYLDSCLDSLMTQSRPPSQIFYIDCGSQDDSPVLVRSRYPEVVVVRNQTNLGFSRAANSGIRASNGEWVLILNPDVQLSPGYCEKCVEELESHPKCAGVIGKILRYPTGDPKRADVIDSTGLVMTRSRRVLDRGAGKVAGSFVQPEGEVFGIPGNSPVYRRAALEDASIGDEFFDEDFFMYKEDVDLSWRFRLLGWSLRYVPLAVAYHDRSTGVVPRRSLREIARARRGLNEMQRHYSYRNHRLMLVKNELASTFVTDFFRIAMWELLSLVWVLAFEPRTVKSIPQLVGLIPGAYRKRQAVMRRRRIETRAIKHWLG